MSIRNIYSYVTGSTVSNDAFDAAMCDLHNGAIKSAHPSVALFIKHFYKYKDSKVPTAARECFLDELHGDKHRRILRNFNRGRSRGFTSICNYIDDLLEVSARLLLVRVDLYYKNDIRHDRDFDGLREERSVFLRSVNKNYKHILGYLWKMEYKETRGHMLHLLVIFNGSKVKNDIQLGKSIGNAWARLGVNRTYYNCNADIEKYKGWGTYAIGDVHYSDSEKITNLKNHLIGHLSQHDPYLVAMMPTRYRTYGKAEIPVHGVGGRPRKGICIYKPHVSKHLWY